ncbi:plasma membrane proteolipid 3 [Stagonosporopsis vannaccii]|nr:plasma membrane proteolipid 3 [Stagonosporopsis vannaccii]
MIKTILLILITIFLPPVGVFLVAGCGADLLINILLTILGYFPGHIHAFYIEYVYFKRREEIRAGTYNGTPAPGVYSTKVQHGGQKNVVAQPAPVAAGVPPAQQGYGTTTV